MRENLYITLPLLALPLAANAAQVQLGPEFVARGGACPSGSVVTRIDSGSATYCRQDSDGYQECAVAHPSSPPPPAPYHETWSEGAVYCRSVVPYLDLGPQINSSGECPNGSILTSITDDVSYCRSSGSNAALGPERPAGSCANGVITRVDGASMAVCRWNATDGEEECDAHLVSSAVPEGWEGRYSPGEAYCRELTVSSCPSGLDINVFPTCACPEGQVQSGTQCITPTIPACSITITPNPVAREQSATISWMSSGAEHFYINTIGYVGNSGSATVQPNATTNYDGTVNGPGGSGICPATLTVDGSSLNCPSPRQLIGGVCRCPSGSWDGSQCISNCPLPRVIQNGTCQCPAGKVWNGSECVFQACPSAAHSRDSVGACCPASQMVNGRCPNNICEAIYYCVGNDRWFGDTDPASCPREPHPCPAGYSCASGACIPPPAGAGTLKVAPSLVHVGEKTNVAWKATGVASCTVRGSNGDGAGGAAGVWNTTSSGAVSGSCSSASPTCASGSVCLGSECVVARESSGITAQTSYTLNCGPPAGTFSPRTASVNILPVFCEVGVPGCEDQTSRGGSAQPSQVAAAASGASSDELHATIRAAITSDPRSALMTEDEIEMMVALLANEAERQGVTSSDITWRPDESSDNAATRGVCGMPDWMCRLTGSFGFDGSDFVIPIGLGVSAAFLLFVLGMMLHHRGHHPVAGALRSPPPASPPFTPSTVEGPPTPPTL